MILKSITIQLIHLIMRPPNKMLSFIIFYHNIFTNKHQIYALELKASV